MTEHGDLTDVRDWPAYGGFREALDAVMDGVPSTATLSMLIGIELRREPAGLSCDELARRLRRRRADVLKVLKEPRFQSTGATCNRRWTLRDGTCRAPGGQRDSRAVRTGEELRAA